MSFPIIKDAPFITTNQMIEVDRLMIEEYGITLIQMMENAGRGLAILARDQFLDGNVIGKSVLVLAGPGGNGGGAMVAARHLAGWGVDVQVALSHDEERITPVPQHQLSILRRMGVPILAGEEVLSGTHDLIIDGVLGYSLKGAPRGLSAKLIQAANKNNAPILSLDMPSGVDATSGIVHSPAIYAAATLTLALPKVGLSASTTRQNVGELFCADIGVPAALYGKKSIGMAHPNLFATSDIVKISF